MKKKLLIVGGKGSGEIAMSVFEAVNEITNEWIIEGFLNDILNPGEYLGKYKVLGSSEQVIEFVDRGYYIHYTLHFNAKNKINRVKDFLRYNIPIEAHASAIHPLAYVNPSTEVGHGVLMLPFSATSFGVKIKDFIHVYTSGFFAHDSVVEDFSTITAHSIVGARVKICTGAHIGLNATIREDIVVGDYSIVGMGTVVTKDVPKRSIYIGNPGRLLSTF